MSAMRIFEKEKPVNLEWKASNLWQTYGEDNSEEKFWKSYQKLITKGKQASQAFLVKSGGGQKFLPIVCWANAFKKQKAMKAFLHRIFGRIVIHFVVCFTVALLLALTMPLFLILWIPIYFIIFAVVIISSLQKHHKRSALFRSRVIIAPNNMERIGGGLKPVQLSYDQILDIKENDLGLHVVIMDKEVTTHAGGVTKDHILKKVAIVFPKVFDQYEKAKELIYFYKENHDASRKHRLSS
ncbi:hypothetical protein BKI52_21785 [marine bacterium AO1-C]|nr:hypothetical protein BKI52_21785 [marine bacterium AO1-C]